ncbi:UDP-glucose 4-epimerase [Caballeronia hypogeia]|uniref:UDP-glucose 4-epimerase n=1 Tax=Caballeronia hypogeia TaxID=1777140 RepID=A0A158D9V6_9BURK|nr:hypothetical protein [Caballeronia hypogeia]SAK91435.1 UDP-glucose 4-epimerase [Caballeronia hypogeia]
MPIKGQVDNEEWSVTCTTELTAQGIVCSIGVEQRSVEGGRFMHRFRHVGTFDNEREAVLAGLKEGMTWIRLRAAKTINL